MTSPGPHAGTGRINPLTKENYINGLSLAERLSAVQE